MFTYSGQADKNVCFCHPGQEFTNTTEGYVEDDSYLNYCKINYVFKRSE